MNGGAVAGLVIGLILCVLAIIAVAYFVIKRRKKKPNYAAEEAPRGRRMYDDLSTGGSTRGRLDDVLN